MGPDILNKVNQYEYKTYEELIEFIRNDKKIIINAQKSNYIKYIDIGERIKYEDDILYYFEQSEPGLLEQLYNVGKIDFDKYKKIGLKIIKESNLNEDSDVILPLKYMTSLQSNLDIAVYAIKKNWKYFQYLNILIKNENKIIEIVLESSGLSLKYMTPMQRNNIKIVTKAIQKNGLALKYTTSILKNNKYIVSEAVKNNAMALWYAHDDIKKDKDVVNIAINQSGTAICYASEDIRNDKKMTMAAIKKDSAAIKYIGNDLKNDIDIAIYVSMEDLYWMKYLGESIRLDKEFIKTMRKKHSINNLVNNNKDIYTTEFIYGLDIWLSTKRFHDIIIICNDTNNNNENNNQNNNKNNNKNNKIKFEGEYERENKRENEDQKIRVLEIDNTISNVFLYFDKN
jgi:hypothetical protein